jgi:polyphosphate glucokinase
MKSSRTKPAGVLVLDIGGSHIKMATNEHATVRVPSGPKLTPRQMVSAVKRATTGWNYDRVSVGYPGVVVHERPIREPHNLGLGWVGFNFAKAFGCDVRMLNDAAMQAAGNYEQGRMLFLGLGTGLGSAMIVEGLIEPMELGHLPYRNGKTYEDYVGSRGLHQRGRAKWEKHVHRVIDALSAALEPDSVVIGGGNARLLKRLPQGVRISDNDRAILGGFRMWQDSFGKKIDRAHHAISHTASERLRG